jgi:hypothetical protein
MRTEIRLSSAPEPTTAAWVWRVWDKGRLLARGQSASELEAEQAVRTLTGRDRDPQSKRPAVGV